MSEESFEQKQAALVEKFSEGDDPFTDEELTRFILERERIRHGITEPGPELDKLDEVTLATLADPKKLGPKYSRDEVVFRRLVDPSASGASYLEESIGEISKAQSKRAQNPRRRRPITELIEDFLEENPELSAKEVGQRLEDHPYIQLVDDEYRHTVTAETLKSSNLASRVSDAKKRLKKNSG